MSDKTRKLMSELAAEAQLGIRRLLLVTPGEELVEVPGGALGGVVSAAGPERSGIEYMDKPAGVEEAIRAFVGVTQQEDFAWLRVRDGVVVVVPVGDGRLLVADTLGHPSAAGVLVSSLGRLARHLGSGRPMRLPRHRSN